MSGVSDFDENCQVDVYRSENYESETYVPDSDSTPKFTRRPASIIERAPNFAERTDDSGFQDVKVIGRQHSNEDVQAFDVWVVKRDHAGQLLAPPWAAYRVLGPRKPTLAGTIFDWDTGWRTDLAMLPEVEG